MSPNLIYFKLGSSHRYHIHKSKMVKLEAHFSVVTLIETFERLMPPAIGCEDVALQVLMSLSVTKFKFYLITSSKTFQRLPKIPRLVYSSMSFHAVT